MRKFESIGHYHDHWAYVLLSAPNNFRPLNNESIDQAKELERAFEDLLAGFHFAERKIKDERLTRIVREMIEMSLEAYVAGDKWKGAHSLQECEGLIWKKEQQKIKYAVEAERRAFGEVVFYANVRVSKYPYEGTSKDLAGDQRKLLKIAESQCHSYLAERKEFEFFAWVCDNDGTVTRISMLPTSDLHVVNPPLQKSWRGAVKRIKELAATGIIRSGAVAQVFGRLGDGVLTFALEQRGSPRVSARCSIQVRSDGSRGYTDVRYFLDDPQFFQDEI